MRWRLRASVGIGQPNYRDDVIKIQMLLNRASEDNHLEHLNEDGIFGIKTSARLAEFQKNSVHMLHADSIVNHNGRTLNILNHGGTFTPPNQLQQAIVPDSAAAKLLEKQASSKSPNYKSAWFNRALSTAKNVKYHWGVPIAVTLAQGALESNWGRHAPGNIYFGVKGKSPNGKAIAVITHENYAGKSTVTKDSFRSYDTLEQSADDYGRFLATNKRYARAFIFRNEPERFIHIVACAGYATDPNYEKKILSIIRSNGLSDYDNPRVTTSASYSNPLHQ
ncbi:glucosaminidase domain-containing protein [Rouxiella sp. Mn2063]|uniref:glucosaminidase domain-containing protein n=1 Tax=Rouxiella sp. Mn2063 TaxID=3395262 RepID=UPI003BBD497E